MELNTTRKNNKIRGIALVALLLGVGSVVVLTVAILLGILVESIGITSFYNLIIPLGLAALICGLIARKKIDIEESANRRAATIGLILGALVLGLLLILTITILIIFIPGPGAHQ